MEEIQFSHKPVLLDECIQGLAIRPDGIYLDGTAGGGGHSYEIARRLTTGRLYSTDKDPDAVRAASERLRGFACAEVIEGDFKDARSLLSGKTDRIDGALLDLGVSSFQLDSAERGFSYAKDGMLDMRMSRDGVSARDLVNSLDAQQLTELLRRYGEEPYAPLIARKIVAAREAGEIETTVQLSEIVTSALPAAARRKEKHPARRTFQALRIAVNDELEVLKSGLADIFELLSPGGRFCVITFHSLEDRIVKQYFASLEVACTCPKDFPVCVCGGKAKARAITRKPIVASEEENSGNRRARSAKLRIIEKLPQ